MYGVNNSVNVPNAYSRYGTNAQAQSPQEQDKTNAFKKAMRADEILFTNVYNADKTAVDALGLSDGAKNLLLELKEKYKGYDFLVGDYETDEQASRILNGGKGTLMNVLITPDLLEEMAADESVRTKYENIIAGASDQFTEMKANLNESGKYYLGSLGLTVNKDGSVEYYAFLKNGLTDEDGKNFIKSSSAKGLAEMLNALAENKKEVSKPDKTDKTDKTDKKDMEIAESNRLSDKARDLLYELMDKYKGYDFIVGNWSSDEEASRVLSHGKGRDGNVLISPELLERMAADENEKAKYIGILDEAANGVKKVKEDITDDAKKVVDRVGVSVDANGKLTYFAKLMEGLTTKDGSNFIKASDAAGLTEMLNAYAEGSKVNKTDEEIEDPNKLSDKARAVLYELMEKYEAYDFIIGRWKTDEEASRVLSHGMSKYGSVLISPDLLEKMAADESVKAEYMGIIDKAYNSFDDVKKNLTDDEAAIVEKLGMTVDADGTISYFAKLADGVKTDDGADFIKCAIIEDLKKSLSSMAEVQKKNIETRTGIGKATLDTPEEKAEKIEKSVMPPKSFKKYERERDPITNEEDYGTLPPESFKKYQKAEDSVETVGETMNYTI